MSSPEFKMIYKSIYGSEEVEAEESPPTKKSITPFTKSPMWFDSPTVDRYVFENSLEKTKLTDEKIEEGIAMMHMLAQHYMGEKVSDVEFDGTVDKNKFLDLTSGINFDALSGDNVIEKSVSAAHLLASVNKENAGKNEQYMKYYKEEIRKAQELAQKIKKGGGNKGGIGNDFLGGGTPEQQAGELDNRMREALLAIGRLNTLATIDFDTNGELVEDDMGSYFEIGYAGISNIERVDWSKVREDNIMDLLDDQIPYLKRMEKVPHKRSVFLLYDFSGSMYTPAKQGMLTAVLMKLVESLHEGNIETLIVAPFIETIGKVTVIKNKAGGVKYIKELKSPTGMDTDVYGCVISAQSMLIGNKIPGYKVGKDRPEVLIVNDGQDHIRRGDPFKYPTHAICLDAENPALEKLCKESKGTYNNIPLY